MTVVLSRNLLSLASVYRVPGGQLPPTNIDFASPIPLVHDVHREAEIGGGPGTYNGFNNISIVNTHAVIAGAIVGTADPYSSAIMATLGNITPQTHWVWLMEVTARITNSLTFVAGTFVISQAGVAGALTTHQRMTHYWDANSATAAGAGLIGAVRVGGEPIQVTLPTIVPAGSTYIATTSASGAIADIVIQVLSYTCPIGTLPPGIA